MKHRRLLRSAGNAEYISLSSTHHKPTSVAFPVALRVLAGMSLAFWPSLLWLPSSLADEQPQQFLEALRESNYHDMALVYLERIQSSPSIDDNFRQGLVFEQAMSLVAAARQQPPR